MPFFSFCERFCFKRFWNIASNAFIQVLLGFSKNLKEKVCKVHKIGLPNA